MPVHRAAHRTDKAWEGGYLNGLQHTLYKLEDIQTAIQLGRSKLQAFRLLISDWRDPESVGRNPSYLPLSKTWTNLHNLT